MNKPDVAMSNAAQLETWKDLSTSNTAKRVEELPFRVIPVNSKDELDAVARIRHHAYGRHLPQFAQSLALPESADFEADAVVLLVVAKQDNAPLATMRIHTNRNKPLPLEQAVTLPQAMRSTAMAEAVRFSVLNGRSGGGGH